MSAPGGVLMAKLIMPDVPPQPDAPPGADLPNPHIAIGGAR
jgi:CNT family concentrative nucleoside transporter